VTPESGKK